MITGHLLILNVKRDVRKDKPRPETPISAESEKNRPVVKTHDIPGHAFSTVKDYSLGVTPKQLKSASVQR